MNTSTVTDVWIQKKCLYITLQTENFDFDFHINYYFSPFGLGDG